MPRAVTELDSALDELVWTDPASDTEAPEPSHVALQPVDADEYEAMIKCAISLELNALRSRRRES